MIATIFGAELVVIFALPRLLPAGIPPVLDALLDAALLAAGAGLPVWWFGIRSLRRGVTLEREGQVGLAVRAAQAQIVLDNALDAVIAIDILGAVSGWNRQAEVVFGWSSAEVIGRDLTDLIVPERFRERHRLSMARLLHFGEGHVLNQRLELPAVRRDGREFPIEVSFSVASIQGTQIFTAFVRDITERRQGEALLAERAHVLEMLAAGTELETVLRELVGVLESQAPGLRCTVLLVDDRQRLKVLVAPSLPAELCSAVDGAPVGPTGCFCCVAAWRGDRVLANDIATDPLWDDLREQALASAIRSCWSEPIRTSIRGLLGTLVLCGAVPRGPEPAEIALIEWAAQLVGLAVERSRDAEDRLRMSLAIASTGDAVVITDLDSVIQYVNPSFSRITGYSAAEGLGKHPSILKSGIQPKEFYTKMYATITSGRTWSGKVINRRKDGSHYNAALTISPVCDRQGQVKGYVGLQRDVTRDIEREDALRDALAHAESADRAKSAFVANMSHEIRTPMSAILGYSEMMLEPDQAPSERVDCLNTIRRNARHLLDLINDILDISKIEAGKMTVERITWSLPQIAVEVVSILRPRALEKGISLKLLFDGPVPGKITTDPLRTRQILFNLIGNAIKFTALGDVTLRIRSEGVAGEPRRVRFEVTDTGIGMSQEEMARLFQAFQQADDSTTRRFGGTGLGLVISKRLAELLGGDITVQSEPGRGATFCLTLPVAQDVELVSGLTEADVKPGPDATSREKIAIKGRILLAEDGLDNQRLISTHLRRAGAEVVIAENGRRAVEAARTSPFDLILMDMQMPELDGYGATSELRLRGYRMPIIALTAHAMPEDRARCLSAGCTDYLTKPVARDVLLQMVADHLSPNRDVLAARPEATPAASAPTIALRSQLADDPDMADLVAEYVAGLPQQAHRLRDLLEHQRMEEIRTAAHQLKGSGGGFGFQEITEAAAAAEAAAARGSAAGDVAREVDALVRLLRRVEGYNPANEQAGAGGP